MPTVQDQDQRTHICMDFKPQDQGEACQVGAGRSGSAAQRVRGPFRGQNSEVELFIWQGMCVSMRSKGAFLAHLSFIKFHIYCNI